MCPAACLTFTATDNRRIISVFDNKRIISVFDILKPLKSDKLDPQNKLNFVIDGHNSQDLSCCILSCKEGITMMKRILVTSLYSRPTIK